MNPAKVVRSQVRQLTDLPNIGRACADDLRRLGITEPAMLRQRDPYELYDQLCRITGQRVDPCMLDVLIAVTRFMDGEAPQAWWHYTHERKQRLAEIEG